MIKIIRFCLLAVLLMVSATANSSTYYSEGRARGVPSSIGKVYCWANADGKDYTGQGSSNAYQSTEKGGQTSGTKYTYTFNCDLITGYTFDGWYEDADCTVSHTTKQQFTADVTSNTDKSKASLNFWAHWTANTYTVAFDGNGSTKGSVASVGATYDQNVTLAANGYRKHQYIVTYDADGGSSVGPDSTLYTFLGWNTEDDGTGDNYSAGATLTKPNFTPTQGDTYTLYAKWSATASSSITLPAAPTKSGYQFEGWYDGDVDVPANKAGDAGDSYTPSDDVTLTARWVEKYDFEVTGSNFTINNEDWNKVDLFTFVHADKANMTVNIGSSDVISYDVESNTITAKKIGTSTISFTQNTSATINTGTSSEWTITVDSVANTLTVSSTSFTKYVEETIPSVRSNQNSNGTISSTSSNPNLAYYDKDDNTIYIPNSDAQTLPLGNVTIIISQAATAKYKAKKDTITLTVQKYQTSFTGSAYNSLLVDGEQTADYSYTNVSAAQPTASSDDDFFYAIEDISYTKSSLNKKYNSLDSLVRFVPSTKKIVPLNAGTGKITFYQAETYKYTGDTVSFDVTVSKRVTSFTGSAYNDLKVDDIQTADYSYTNVSADAPTASSDDDFFYAIEDISYTKSSLNKKYNDLDSLVRFVPSTKNIVALNAGTGKITFYQAETYKYSGDTVSFDVTVSKNENTLYANGSASFSSSMYVDSSHDSIALTATNTDYSSCPITLTQTKATNDTVSFGYNSTTRKIGISSHHFLTTATWRMQQAENYKYEKGDNTFTVNVVKAAETTCYVLENQSADQSVWHGETCHEHTWNAENAAGVVHFQIYKYAACIDPGYKVQQYLNGEWVDVTSKKTDLTTDWTWKSEDLDRAAKGVRIWGSGSLKNHVKNVYVTRDTYLNAANVTVDKQADGQDLYKNTEGKDTLTISYSISNGGSLKLSCDNSKFKFTDIKKSATESYISLGTSDCEDSTLIVPVYYQSTKLGNDTAHIVIYNNVYSTTATIISTTIKRTPVVTAPTAKELTYTGSAQNLVNAGSTTGGTLQYALGAGEFSTSIPQATNAGDYTVYYKVIENDDYYGTDPVGVSVSIKKANSVLTSAPTAEEDLVYSGSAQSLVSAGTATNGTLQYALGEGEFSTSIPQATNAGTYTVNYKVVGDANYNDVAASSLEVTIDKANSSISTAPTAKELTYTGSAQNLVNAGTATGGTLQYAFGEGEFSTSIPQATAIGSYTVYYRVAANDNYNGIDAEDLAVTISPKASSIEEESSWEDVDEYTAVAIPEGEDIVIEDTVSVYSLDIDESSTFTIAPTGCLRVGEGGITGASAERLILQAVTDTKKATLGQTSAILFSPDYEGAMPTAKVEMYSVGYKDMTNPSVNRWQYVGVPVDKADYAAKTAFPRSLVRSWDESEPDEADGWKNTRNTLKLQPFMGIATTYYFGSDGCKMTFEGQLAANRGTHEISLTHSGNGWNLIANSFAGPIDVTKLTTDDFGGATATLYIWDTQSQDYIELPVATIAELKDRQHVVPSMQAFFVYTESATTLSLNYERLVWNGEESNVPLKAKRRENGESSVNAKMYISITDGVSTDNLCLLESQNYDAAYENGYDAPKKFSDADVNAIYSIKDDYLLSVDATNSIAGTKLGLRTRESDFYLMTFTRIEGDGEWYLLDKNTEEKVRIQEGMEYEFTAAPNSTIEGRFEIVGTANTPAITTEVDNTDAAQKAEKYIKDNTLVILKGGTKYNSLGQKIQ